MLVTAIWTGLQTRLGAAWWIRDFFRWLFEKASCPSKPWKSAWTMSVHHWSLGERLSSLNIGAATANHVLATSCNRSLSLSIATIYHTAILKDSSNLFIGAGMSRISSGTTRALEEQEAMRKLFFFRQYIQYELSAATVQTCQDLCCYTQRGERVHLDAKELVL